MSIKGTLSNLSYRYRMWKLNMSNSMDGFGFSIRGRVVFYFSVLGLILLGYIVGNPLGYNDYGIRPRTVDFAAFYGIAFGWTMHSNYEHIHNNVLTLLQLMLPFVIFEKRPVGMFALLILLSGFAVWLTGSPNSVHIGASGVIFALIGYTFTSAWFSNRWLTKIVYIVVTLMFGLEYWYVVRQGLIPQEGISFAGHFGGLTSGIIVALAFSRQKKHWLS